MRYLLLFSTFLQISYAQDVPRVRISNGQINAEIYLPDSEKGYYQGTRFDWSGVMPVLEYDGHSYFGKWFKNYDPKVHESVMGPVEEFSPIGYEEAGVGETFMKIGVGTLIKPKEQNFGRFKTYEIHNAGEWDITKSSNAITFKHTLATGDYPYEYEKIIRLTAGKPEMVLEHTFTNTGNNTIETEVYNHNFFLMDTMNIGSGYSVKFPFDLVGEGEVRGIGEFAEINGKELVYIKSLGEKDNVFIGSLTGHQTTKNAYDIQIENKTSGAGVRITCDRPLSRLVFWSAQKTVCPEPYTHIKVAPGKTFTWKINYYFYTF